MIILLGILLILISLIILARFKIQHGLEYFRMAILSKGIPGPTSIPFIGNSFLFVQQSYNMGAIFQSLFSSYGDIFKIWIGTRLYIVLASSSAVQSILSSKQFLDKNTDYSMLHKWLGSGVATANGDAWLQRRKLLNKAFTFAQFENVCNVSSEQSKILVDTLEQRRIEILSKNQEFDISPMLGRCAMDILAETGMNTQLGCQEHRNENYFRASVRASEILFYKMLRPWTNFPIVRGFLDITKEETECYRTIHSFTEKIIKNRRLQRENEDTGTGPGFLDLLLDAQVRDDSITDQAIRMELDTFMFGGQDTVTTNLTWILRMLSIYPDVQEKARSEVRTVFGICPVDNVLTSHIAQMKYLECVIKETLRLYPSGPVFNRTVHNDFTLDNGMVLPRGSSVQINAFLLHRNPKYFPNPEKFDPDRFLNHTIQPYTFVAFSAGPRNCIGQSFARIQEKVVLAFLLSRYDILPGEGMNEIQYSWDLVLRPKFGAVVKLLPIKNYE